MRRVGPLLLGLLLFAVAVATAQDSVRVCALLKETTVTKGHASRAPLDSAKLARFEARLERHTFRKAFPGTSWHRLAPVTCGWLAPSDFGHVQADAGVDSLWLDNHPDHPLDLPADAVARAEEIPWGVAWEWNGVPPAYHNAVVRLGPMDTGADTAHIDLKPLWGLYDANGQNNPTDNIPGCNGHGTHVTGTIGARENGIGVVGVLPHAELVHMKVFIDFAGSCAAFESTEINALNWAVSHGVRVVSVSIGSVGQCGAGMNAAITSAAQQGVYTVVAAGNDGGALNKPANCTDAFAIGSHNSSGQRSGFSSWDARGCTQGPGEGINSTMPGGGWGGKSGTSMATPHVAAVVGMILGIVPQLALAPMKATICNGDHPLNAAKAVGMVTDPLWVSQTTVDVSAAADTSITIQVPAVVNWCVDSSPWFTVTRGPGTLTFTNKTTTPIGTVATYTLRKC